MVGACELWVGSCGHGLAIAGTPYCGLPIEKGAGGGKNNAPMNCDIIVIIWLIVPSSC